MRRAIFPVVCFVLLIVETANVHADEDALRAAVDEMFELGWSGSFKSHAPTDNQFKKIQQIQPGDVRAVYAYAIVQIKQRRYKDAAQLLTHLVEYKPDHMRGWKAKAWLSMFTKDYSKSLVELDRVSRMLPEKEASVEEKIANLETAQFLGRMFGYLEGPQENAVTDVLLKSYKDRIIARLGQDRTFAFEDANKKVVGTFAKLDDEINGVEQQANEDAQQQREQKLADLDQERAKLEERLAKVGPEAKKLESEMREELKSIEAEDRPLLQQFERLAFQREGIQREARIFTADILRLQGQLGRSEDPTTNALIQDQLRQRTLLANQYQAQIRQVEIQMAQVDAKRVGVRRRYGQTEASYRGQLEKLGVEFKDIKKQEKKNEFRKKQADKSSSADLRRVRTLATKAKALSTYQDFNFDLERQQILEMFE